MSIKVKKALVVVLTLLLAVSLIYAFTDHTNIKAEGLQLRVPFKVRQTEKLGKAEVFRNKVLNPNFTQTIKSVSVRAEEISEERFSELKKKYSAECSEYAKVSHPKADMFYGLMDSGPSKYYSFIKRNGSSSGWFVEIEGLNGDEIAAMLKKASFVEKQG